MKLIFALLIILLMGLPSSLALAGAGDKGVWQKQAEDDIRHGRADDLEKLLKAGHIKADGTTIKGIPFLVKALEKPVTYTEYPWDARLVKVLLENGASANLKYTEGRWTTTMINLANWNGKYLSVAELLKHGGLPDDNVCYREKSGTLSCAGNLDYAIYQSKIEYRLATGTEYRGPDETTFIQNTKTPYTRYGCAKEIVVLLQNAFADATGNGTTKSATNLVSVLEPNGL